MEITFVTEVITSKITTVVVESGGTGSSKGTRRIKRKVTIIKLNQISSNGKGFPLLTS